MMKLSLKIFCLLVLGFFSFLMIKISIPYFSFNDQVAFLRIKQWIIHNSVWKTAFYVHVITSTLCLLAGFTQFSKGLLNKFPGIHRFVGWIYIITVLAFSGPSGFIMSLFANGGLLSQTAFTTLSVLWMYFTYRAFYFAKTGNYSQHRKFMIRSYALTLSALTLRAWKFLIVLTIRPQPMDAYMLVAWIGWVPNLLFAEWYIRQGWQRVQFLFAKRGASN
jgi:uncharacterized membrane protein